MKVTFFDWDVSKTLIQRLFAQTAYECRVESYSAPVAKDQFAIPHTLAPGLMPNSVTGTVMDDGYLYYSEADRAMWSANMPPGQQGYVYVRCSKAKAKCEVQVRVYDA